MPATVESWRPFIYSINTHSKPHISCQIPPQHVPVPRCSVLWSLLQQSSSRKLLPARTVFPAVMRWFSCFTIPIFTNCGLQNVISWPTNLLYGRKNFVSVMSNMWKKNWRYNSWGYWKEDAPLTLIRVPFVDSAGRVWFGCHFGNSCCIFPIFWGTSRMWPMSWVLCAAARVAPSGEAKKRRSNNKLHAINVYCISLVVTADATCPRPYVVSELVKRGQNSESKVRDLRSS